jgi:hypothetical protein
LSGRSFFEHREQDAPDQSIEGSFLGAILGGVGQQCIEQGRASGYLGAANQSFE